MMSRYQIKFWYINCSPLHQITCKVLVHHEVHFVVFGRFVRGSREFCKNHDILGIYCQLCRLQVYSQEEDTGDDAGQDGGDDAGPPPPPPCGRGGPGGKGPGGRRGGGPGGKRGGGQGGQDGGQATEDTN
jgi:hypothetical protein